jgi:hypothetical protein
MVIMIKVKFTFTEPGIGEITMEGEDTDRFSELEIVREITLAHPTYEEINIVEIER